MDLKIIQKKLLNLSNKALKKGELPISALLVKDNKIIAAAYNKKNINKSSLFHAEILCILKASKKLKTWNLNGCILYVTLEPCSMCKEVIEESRIDQVFFFVSKGKVTNKYKKTKYEQTYVSDGDIFRNNIKNFFETLRK